ncbi:MAG: DUF5668 domain-containing protein [Bacteroidota bacterium]
MHERRRFGSQVVIGTLLILAGVALLLENQGLIEVGSIWRYWPLIIVAFGVAKLARARSREEQGSGLWITIIGLWFLVSILHLWDLGFGDTWPALFIAFGVSMLWKSLPPMSSHDLTEEKPHEL